MKKVLVFTGIDDPMWPFLLEACSEKEKKEIILFPTDQPRIAQCTYSPWDKKVVFTIREEKVYGETLNGIWLRRFVTPDLNHLEQNLQQYCEKEYMSFFEGLEYALTFPMWVSLPSSISRARNKTYQLKLAKKLGLKTLDTIFTNSPGDLQEFYDTQECIYKSIRSPRIPIHEDMNSTVFTTLLDEKYLEHIEGIQTCPGILQKFCKKTADIRVTVFGNQVFSVKIESQESEKSKVDFRSGARNLPHKIYELPDDLCDKCVSITKDLGLSFSAIDFALLDDNSHIFFEVNPNGQWGWLEEKLGLPMRRALLDILFKTCE